MTSVTLRELTIRDEGPFLFGARRCSPEDLKWYSFIWNWNLPFQQYLQKLADNKAGVNLAPDRVPDTMLYGFLENQIIGRVNIRHNLNEEISHRGGHLGYWIHPDFRGMGYGFEMVREALPICKNLGLTKILITCADDNFASIRIIEKLGGSLENKVADSESGEKIRWYWLSI